MTNHTIDPLAQRHVRISCVLTARQLDAAPTDLIVFPEGIQWEEVANAQSSHPNSIIVGAIVENRRSRGLLLQGGKNRIEYFKVQNDGRTVGSGDIQQEPVYQLGDVCAGVLICMDAQHVEFSMAVIEKVRRSSAKLKLICIPADMDYFSFSGDSLPHPRMFEGIHVILCNHTKTHQVRCKSFVTDAYGKKLVEQMDDEPIHAELPLISD
jgi:predicted amidohydrolase